MRAATRATIALALLAGSMLLPMPAAPAAPVRCYPAADVFPDEVTRLAGPIDGDRLADVVRTRARWLDDETCRGFLVVRLDGAVLRREIDARLGIMIGPPGLAGLVELDRRPGLEIAVVTWLGASTGFVEVYGLRGGELVSLASDVFEYAGSVVHPTGVDCVRRRGAVLVSSSAEYLVDESRYAVERRFYALRGGTLRPVPRLTERVSVRPSRLGRFLELVAGVPFPSCTVVVGAS